MLGPLRHYRQKSGSTARDQLIASLPTPDRRLFEHRIRKTEWYPYSAYIALLGAIDRSCGTGNLAYCQTVGYVASKADLNSVFRIYAKLASPERLIRACARVWESYYSVGTMRAVAWEPDRTILRIEGFPQIDPAHCQLMRGWMVGAMELIGARVDPHATESVCAAQGGPYCEFQASWSTHADITPEVHSRRTAKVEAQPT